MALPLLRRASFCLALSPRNLRERSLQHRWSPVVVGLVVGAPALAGFAHGQTLNETLAAAYANSPVLRAERSASRR